MKEVKEISEKEFMENYKEQTPKEEPTKVVNKDNNINFKDQKYDGFLSFLNANSKNIISDSKYYFVYRNKSKRLKFQMILDKSKEKL